MQARFRIVLLLFGIVYGQIIDVDTPRPSVVDARQAAKSLLQSGWEKNQANREMSLEDFSPHVTDPEFLLAFTLNRMQHSRYTEALASANSLTKSAPEVLEGWVLRIWLDTLTDNYEQALASMRPFKDEFDKANKLDDQTRNEIIAQLGRLFGYMQGPVEKDVNAAFLNATMVAVTNGFDQAQMDLFNKNREAVLTQFEDLSKAHDQTISNEEARVAQNNVVETQNINNQNVLIEQRINELQPRFDALEQEAYAKLDQVSAEIEPLQREASLVDSQLNSSLYTLDTMFNEYYFYQQNYRRHPNLPYLLLQIRDQQFVIGSLRNQLRSINSQIYAAEDRAAQIQADYEDRISQISDELESMGVARRKNERRLGKLAAGPDVARGKLTALSNRAKALKTYDPFPLELARQRTLEQLK